MLIFINQVYFWRNIWPFILFTITENTQLLMNINSVLQSEISDIKMTQNM